MLTCVHNASKVDFWKVGKFFKFYGKFPNFFRRSVPNFYVLDTNPEVHKSPNFDSRFNRLVLVEVLNGGLTNKLYICSTQTENNEVLKVILRIYGLIMQVKNHDGLIQRQVSVCL